MSAPGIGALIAITDRSAVDDPCRFDTSPMVGAYFGLTLKKCPSGASDIDNGTGRIGDAMVRRAMFEALHIILTRTMWLSTPKRRAMEVAQRRGMKRARVAFARKRAVVSHRMWNEVAMFRWAKDAATT